ncbi:MAG: hypothetical protein KGZ89_04530 [Actinobacteria bacterium]|nr:hypothetical protein [Actinomycetota bacterium]
MLATTRNIILILLISMAFLSSIALLGCAATGGDGGSAAGESATEDGASEETPTAQFTPPENTDLSTPEKAVRTYLDWISYAYRTKNPQAAWDYMTSWEFVRVDAYAQKNLAEGRGIDQQLTVFDITQVSGSETTKSVDTNEEWVYRYFGPDGEYISEELTATFANRYTVVRDAQRGVWLVDRVYVTPKGEVE